MLSSAAHTPLSLARHPVHDETALLTTPPGWLPRVELVGSRGPQNIMSFTQHCVPICHSIKSQAHLLNVMNTVNSDCGPRASLDCSQHSTRVVSSGAFWWFVLAASAAGAGGAATSSDAPFSSLLFSACVSSGISRDLSPDLLSMAQCLLHRLYFHGSSQDLMGLQN